MSEHSSSGFFVRFVQNLFALIVLVFAGVVLSAAGIYLYLVPQLPDVDSLKHITFKTPLQVFSKDGHLIAEFGDEHTTPLRYSQIPPLFIKAVTAAEDDRFFTHEGVDPRGLARACWELMTTGSIHTGGSTITMQVAKNYFLSRERTFSRKFTEILLAHEIERTLNKQEILTLYVNKIFLGHRAYGIAAAAQVYFGKRIDQLSLPQMAMIAGLPKAPSRYNPVDNAPRALQRRNWILSRMRTLGYISFAQYQQAVTAPIDLNYRGTVSEVSGLYLAEMVRDTLVQRFGKQIYTSGWKVYTTVPASVQNAAHDAVRQGLMDYDHRHGYRGPEGHAYSAALSTYNTVNGMIPGEVTRVDRQSAVVLLRDGEYITIPWSGLAWASKALPGGRHGYLPKIAAEIVKEHDIVRCFHGTQGWQLTELPQAEALLVALDPQDGAVMALDGGFDFYFSKFNRVVQGGRQVGSSIKPFLYASALNKGFTPFSLIDDAPLSFSFGNTTWTPQNDDGEFMGPITLRRALYLSRNLVSIRLLQNVGLDYAINYMNRFGLPVAQLPRNLTLALGTADLFPIQMATAYATFANGGYRINPYYIDRITDAAGKLIFQAHPLSVCGLCDDPAMELGHAPRVIPDTVAYMMNSILRDVIVHGTGRGALAINRTDVAGKTGTTNEARDAWFDGYSPNLVAITWVGFDNPSSLGPGEFGGVAAVPIWNYFMQRALAKLPQTGWTAPADMSSVWVNRSTGKVSTVGDPDAVPDVLPTNQVLSLSANPPPVLSSAAPMNAAQPSFSTAVPSAVSPTIAPIVTTQSIANPGATSVSGNSVKP